mmetsp:Transcript_21937/g.44801  ORF Transcript_21937/g.44801 Transcript_21937/m.44801 type:complete len:391 (-) Transcript_21937:61-1233(-)
MSISIAIVVGIPIIIMITAVSIVGMSSIGGTPPPLSIVIHPMIRSSRLAGLGTARFASLAGFARGGLASLASFAGFSSSSSAAARPVVISIVVVISAVSIVVLVRGILRLGLRLVVRIVSVVVVLLFFFLVMIIVALVVVIVFVLGRTDVGLSPSLPSIGGFAALSAGFATLAAGFAALATGLAALGAAVIFVHDLGVVVTHGQAHHHRGRRSPRRSGRGFRCGRSSGFAGDATGRRGCRRKRRLRSPLRGKRRHWRQRGRRGRHGRQGRRRSRQRRSPRRRFRHGRDEVHCRRERGQFRNGNSRGRRNGSRGTDGKNGGREGLTRAELFEGVGHWCLGVDGDGGGVAEEDEEGVAEFHGGRNGGAIIWEGLEWVSLTAESRRECRLYLV